MPTATLRAFPHLRDDLQSALLASYPELISRLRWSRAELVAYAAADPARPPPNSAVRGWSQ
jgi:hypothetical protein